MESESSSSPSSFSSVDFSSLGLGSLVTWTSYCQLRRDSSKLSLSDLL